MLCEVRPHLVCDSAGARTHLMLEVDREAAVLIATALRVAGFDELRIPADALASNIEDAYDRWIPLTTEGE